MEHPKGFYMLSSATMLESFSYFVFAVILVLYMTDVLHFTDSFSTYFFGIAYGMTYLFQIVGGYLSDRYLGNRKVVLIGIILIAIAQLIFTYDASPYHISANMANHSTFLYTNQEILFLIAVIVMSIGVSFFTVSITSFISLFYKEDSKLVDSAFSIFYLFRNIGGFLAPVVVSSVVGIHDPKLYQYGFLYGLIAIIACLILFLAFKNKTFVSVDGKPLGVTPSFKLQKENKQKSSAKLSKSEISNLKAIALILMAVIVFLMFSQQIFTTIILFAKQHVNNILPIINSQISPSLYVSINPLFIIILTPIYLKLFHKLSEKNMAVNTYTKIGIGLLLTGIAFLVLFIATHDLNANTKINMVWIILFSFFLDNAELLIIPVSLSLTSKLAPKKYASSIMGIFYVSFSIASIIGGVLASAFPNNSATMLLNTIPIANIQTYFMIFAIIGLLCGALWLLFRKKIENLTTI